MNLSCESVTKKIRNSTVIDNISFQWNGSNVYGLCGSNGSGKTMLLRIISGLIFPTSGCVKVNGKMLGKDLEFPPSMGMLLENPSFLNPYTGKKNLELIASLNGGKEDDVRKAILAVGLSPDDSRKYKKYSLGMKQRLGIAAAIMENPENIQSTLFQVIWTKNLQAQVQAKSIINIIQKITLNSPKKTLILRMEHLQLQ